MEYFRVFFNCIRFNIILFNFFQVKMRVVNTIDSPVSLDAGGPRWIRITSLPRWGASISGSPVPQPADYSASAKPRHKEAPFIEDRLLNNKLILW